MLGGNVVAPPKRTSYGFISLIEGRLMSASTGSGTVIWRKSIKGVPSAFFTINDENFVYITTDNATKLSLYSPDGIFLWEAELAEPAVADPIVGRDGRVFIVSKTSISCYGTQGTRKWFTRVPEGGTLPLSEMNDGSLLYIPFFTKNDASIGIRISPYGESLEEIEFTGRISTLTSFSDGIIFGFENGTIGSCAVINNVTETTWALAPQKTSNAVPQVIIPGYDGFCVLFSNSHIAEYSLHDQSLMWQLTDHKVQAGQNFFSAYDNGRYVFASQNYTVAYQNAQSSEGVNTLWQKQVSSSEVPSFPIVTSSAYLIIASSNWIISGYNLLDEENFNEINRTQIDDNKIDVYTGFRSRNKNPSLDQMSFETMMQSLSAGDYASLELEYKQFIQNYLTQYQTEYMNSTDYFSNLAEKSNVVMLAAKFETSDYDYLIPLMLKNEKDPSIIVATLRAARTIAYDPDEIMLKAIEYLYNTQKSLLSPTVLSELSEAVYSICRYMGRPALTKRGKEILSSMLLPGTYSTAQIKAQEILLRFIDLET